MFLKAFKFVNEKIFRNTKESTTLGASTMTILGANLKHDLRYRFKSTLKLQNPNKSIQFPLPNRWSTDKEFAKQQLFMVIKQVSLNMKASGEAQKKLINKQQDRSQAQIYHLNFVRTNNQQEIKQVDRIINRYATFGNQNYNTDRQHIFAESIINGEHSYMLRKFGCDQFQIPESKAIDQAYRRELLRTLENEEYNNENLKTAGLTKKDIINRISKGDNVYSMLFEDLEALTKGDILTNKPTIFMDNEVINDTHYLQSPYPIFLKVNNTFLCIAIGYRYNIRDQNGYLVQNKVQFYSPFFSRQPEKIWRLAQSHLLQAILNDFHVRVHLGLYHFTTNQYHVPIYNYCSKLNASKREGLNYFLRYAYDIFNRGLEGVNVSATAALVHPVPEYSLVNKVFNLSQQSAVTIIANYSNRVNLAKISPHDLLEQNGIKEDVARSDLIRFKLDLQFYDIISRYVEDAYHIFGLNELASDLMVEINNEVDNMSVGGLRTRPKLREPKDVLALLKNLVFCWAGYHTHTFSSISLANYWSFRPSMLKIPIPLNPKEWTQIKVGDEIPHTKILMETGKLIEATTQRDLDNMLLDVIQEQAFLVQKEIELNLVANVTRHKELLVVLERVVKELQEYSVKLAAINAERQKDSLVLNYLNPATRQTSLNI